MQNKSQQQIREAVALKLTASREKIRTTILEIKIHK
jgi:hypothetical protein